MMKVMESYKRSANFYNSFGLDTKKTQNATKKPLGEANT